MAPKATRAIRASVSGAVQGVGFREFTRRRAGGLGLMGWVRNQEDGTVAVHAEGAPQDVDALIELLQSGPRGARVSGVSVAEVRVEGHEQFGIRGVSAGAFLVAERDAPTRGFELQLEVDGAVRTWGLPKGPSLDPAVKRLALQGPVLEAGGGGSAAAATKDEPTRIWDSGPYEQGGRVPWPEAIERGHAVFVLHGAKLRGGFALQRTGRGSGAQWLLVKRRDEHARPGSDVVSEEP